MADKIYIIHFPEEEEYKESYFAVHPTWLLKEGDETFCHWPPAEMKPTYLLLRQKLPKVNKEWSLLQCSVKSVASK
jgi:hypothetical protein